MNRLIEGGDDVRLVATPPQLLYIAISILCSAFGKSNTRETESFHDDTLREKREIWTSRIDKTVLVCKVCREET